MTSHTTEASRKAFTALPPPVQRRAREAYKTWKSDSSHPSLQFKRVHTVEPIYSVRVGIGWRALGVRSGDTIVWFWIGSHSDYDKILYKL